MLYSSLSKYKNAGFPSELADVRGFEVRTRDDDDKVGKVDDLVITADGQIRYLDVDLGGFFNPRHVALPIGVAQVDRQNEIVWITGMTKDEIKALPDYMGDASVIDDRYEDEIRRAYRGRRADADLYDQGRFYAERGGARARDARLVLHEEQLVVGKRQVQAGEVELRKTVETEHVRESVPLVHEEATVERRPVSGREAAAGDIGEDSIRVPLMREEAVVDKRVVPTEEVVLNKRAVTEERVVEEDVRRERLATEGVEQTRARGADKTAGARGVRGSGAADRATDSGPLDRAADKLDDLKDRVDANPASRPGPDKTDRRI